MIAYLWVAMGSALGGAARYGIGVAAARLWGQAFPWGTIAINIAGSFAIGFFGTLTAPEGLAPAGVNLRLFVMVGICGGFTTFSSFSLQTLDLARGGQWLGAASNVLLSVAACLVAVAAGHLGAARLNGLRTSSSAMPVHVLAVLEHPDTAHAVLVTAGLAAKRLGDARLEVLHVRPDPMRGFMPTEEVVTEERQRQVHGDNARTAAALRNVFDDWRRETGIGLWREATGPSPQAIASEGRGAGVVVLARPHPRDDGGGGKALHAVLFDAGAATLLAADKAPASLGKRVAVAWKSPEATGPAVDAALPLLAAADTVAVLTEAGSNGEDAATRALLERLGKAGPEVALHRFDAAGRDIGPALLDEARLLGADLLVMGAYSRSRVSELVLGGATRAVLAWADIPVLMRH